MYPNGTAIKQTVKPVGLAKRARAMSSARFSTAPAA
jgi:hypothetical protein